MDRRPFTAKALHVDIDPRPRNDAIDLATHPVVELDGLRFEPSTRQLHGPGGPVTLEPRVLQLLLALAGSAGGVVSRDRLLQLCWAGSVVGDDAIHRAVAGARRGLRQAGAAGWTVETIPRVGYRLVAMPAGAAAPGGDADAPRDTLPTGAVAAPAAAWRRRRVQAALVGAAVLLAGGAGSWVGWRGRRDAGQVRAAMAQARASMRLASPAADRAAVTTLEAALREGTDDVAAWGLLALARMAVANAAAPQALPPLLAGVEQAAGHALAQDAAQPDALTARALLLPAFGRWADLDAALGAVLARHPEHLPALDARALLWASIGVIAAHYPLRLKTAAAEPLHAGYNFRSIFSHWMNGNLPGADQAGERGLELWPQHLPTWSARSSLLAFTGRAERALAMLDLAPVAWPLSLREHARRVWLALASGAATDRAAARASALAGLEGGGPLAAVGATLDLAALGEVELALDVTESFLLERGPLRAGTLWRPGQPWHVDVRRRFTNHLFLPVMAPLRRDPRFGALVQDIGLARHWARMGRAPDHLHAG